MTILAFIAGLLIGVLITAYRCRRRINNLIPSKEMWMHWDSVQTDEIKKRLGKMTPNQQRIIGDWEKTRPRMPPESRPAR